MAQDTQTTTVGQLPTPDATNARIPALLTRAVWFLWLLSCGALLAVLSIGDSLDVAGIVRVDGLTVLMWLAVTFFSGIVHSYSRRYMAGDQHLNHFFGRVFAFTLIVMGLVAANNFVVFWVAWLAMGLVMADLIGHVDEWPQAQAAASLARRYFLASSATLAIALATLWYHTGVTSISGLTSTADTTSTVLLFVAGALLLAAMIQSALLPFQTWLLSSMTAPTPASALMHAGFVNAGGILLTRFGPVVTVDPGVMLAIVLVGAASALGGKLLKTVQTDIKRTLGCSTVGQMGFMIMQAGLGFFGAAITHLILHGFYKAYQFLASGSRVAHESPTKSNATGSPGLVGIAVVLATALVGGGLFAVLTGKGTALDSGLLLTLFVVLMVVHAARQVVTRTALPTTIRYGGVPLVALPALTLYALVYRAVEGLLAGLPAVGHSVELTVIHGLVAAVFVTAYIAIETGLYRHSKRLYVTLLNASQPPSETVLTSTEEYNEY